MELEDLDFTRNGNEVRRFKLVDAAGSFFRCAGMAQNARSAVLQGNYEVVVFFATVRGPIETSVGVLDLMKDATIVSLGLKFLYGSPTYEIHIQQAE